MNLQRDYCAIEHLALPLSNYKDWGKSSFFMLTSYMDESGGVNTPIMVIAGYVAKAQRWARFERD